MRAATHPAQPKRSSAAGQGLGDRGVGFSAAFTVATLLMVVAIRAVGMVDSWWVLAPVVLVDFAVGFGVIRGIPRLLSDDGA